VPAIVRERRKQDEPSGLTINLINSSKPDLDAMTRHSRSTTGTQETPEKLENTTESSDRFKEDTNYSKDIAMLRYNDEYMQNLDKNRKRAMMDNCLVLNETTFLSLMNKRLDDTWATVECI
jgi:hypothetical protein